MEIADILKKTLAFGIGAAAMSAEKLKAFTDEMVSKGEMTQDEARNFIDDASKKADEEKIKLQDWMKDQMSKMMHQFGVAESERVTELECRISELEAKVKTLEHVMPVTTGIQDEMEYD